MSLNVATRFISSVSYNVAHKYNTGIQNVRSILIMQD